jgi:deoxyribonuclease-1-like protein
MAKPKQLFVFLLVFLCFESVYATISVCSWNIENLGNSKNDAEIDFIASTILQFDVIAIQEVVAGDGGAQAVDRLVRRMNRNEDVWEYALSDATFSSSYKTERYAFIWNKKTVKQIGLAWLDNNYAIEIDREPYFGTFSKDGLTFTVVNFHAKTKTKQPETDIKYFKFFPALYPQLNLIFCGDFNCPQSHTVFNPLKAMGFKPVFVGQKTTLRTKCLQNDCLASEFDNIFYHPSKIALIKSGVIHFYKSFPSMEKARMISDHIPIYMTIK